MLAEIRTVRRAMQHILGRRKVFCCDGLYIVALPNDDQLAFAVVGDDGNYDNPTFPLLMQLVRNHRIHCLGMHPNALSAITAFRAIVDFAFCN